MGGPGRTQLRISNDEDLRRVHAMRASVDAILVGVGTVVADDPKLTVKWDLAGRAPGPPPARVILDPSLRAPLSAQVFSSAAPTWIFTGPETEGVAGLAVERVPLGPLGLDLKQVLARLEGRGVRRLMVEGGPRTLAHFFRGRLVDQATLFVAPKVLGSTDVPRFLEEPFDLNDSMTLVDAHQLGNGILVSFARR